MEMDVSMRAGHSRIHRDRGPGGNRQPLRRLRPRQSRRRIADRVAGVHPDAGSRHQLGAYRFRLERRGAEAGGMEIRPSRYPGATGGERQNQHPADSRLRRRLGAPGMEKPRTVERIHPENRVALLETTPLLGGLERAEPRKILERHRERHQLRSPAETLLRRDQEDRPEPHRPLRRHGRSSALVH